MAAFRRMGPGGHPVIASADGSSEPAAVREAIETFFLAIQKIFCESDESLYEFCRSTPLPSASVQQRILCRPICRPDGSLEAILALARLTDGEAWDANDGDFLVLAGRLWIIGQTFRSLLKHQLERDGLTGLINRAGLERVLVTIWDECRRRRLPVGFALLDVDNFKQTNDTIGHPAGDRILRQLSQLAQQALVGAGYNQGVLARYGGDELVVVLPGATGETALAFARDLLQMIRRNRFSVGNKRYLRVTVSMGVASSEGGMAKTPDALLALADRALLYAKRLGRNRVCAWAFGNPPAS